MSVKTILVAHPSASVRERISAALAEARHACVAAPTAAVAMQTVRRSPVSLALADAGLSDNAAAFLRRLREGSGGRPIPVIVFAGSVRSASDVEAFAAIPVAGYLNESAPIAGILPALAPHLFPDSFNRRTGPRIMLAVPISFQAGRAINAATTFDVAASGLGIRTMEPLPQGTALELVFRLPGQTADVRASGRVSWSDRHVGMGVRFEHIAADCQGAIDRFIGDRT
jgi:CheY-like chemotaxis protein